MNENRCIICGEKRNGLPVKEDFVIGAIRWFKRNVTRNERGYRLVVCKDCYKEYHKSRAVFERRQMAYIALGVIFTAVLFFASGLNVVTIPFGIALTLFLYALLLAGRYMPAVETPRAAAQPEGQKR
ncbi:MAG: hypothetical protein KGH98_00820 [Candidatus Micrarchaeota archaeon]|nr:hypothetical protein [Candidatus Micrarchaeota archaeon]